jgi:cytochrome c553
MHDLMKRAGYLQRLTVPVVGSALLALLLGATTINAASAAPAAATQQDLSAGERIYREGILPSGEQLRALVKGERAIPGLAFTCASCHLRSGLGALDEGVFTPPINGAKLFKPLRRLYKGIEQDSDPSLPPLRPAYTEESLVRALRDGKDPNGRALSEAMPRYHLSDKDAGLLVAYLKQLSSQFSPGVSESNIRFATVISEDAPANQSSAMLATMNNYFNMKNNQIRSFRNPRGTGVRSRMMSENMFSSRELSNRTLSLSRWTLKGPPESWRGQLEEYNRREPVFALLGGMVNGSWRPVHQFCEENGIPALFPITDLPVVSDSDGYTLYLSKGYSQEGESAARYLHENVERLKGKQVVQIVRASADADALSAGFQRAWQGLGHPAAATILVPSGKVLDRKLLQKLLAMEKPAALVVWDDATALPALEEIGRNGGLPGMVFLSARYLGESIWTLNESIRDATYLTYPFAFSPFSATSAMGKQRVLDEVKTSLSRADQPLKGEIPKIVGMTNSLTQVLTSLLMDLNGNYYRDNFLDVAGMMSDQQHPLFGRISFGAGQRYASAGCFIVQLSHGSTPELVKKSARLSR